jgi:FG-GAP-like repeat/Immunoglobulin domain
MSSLLHRMPARVLVQPLEGRVLLSATAVSASTDIPFQHIVIDSNPGPTPVIKVLGDLNGDGKLDAIIGHETTTGGPGGIDWYEFPQSGNPNDPWIKHSLAVGGSAYEAAVPFDVNGDGAVDLVISYKGKIVWFRNPLGSGGDPTTDPWLPTFIGGAGAHEMYITDLDGDGKPDVVTNDFIYFQNSPKSWQQVAAPQFNRTQKGLSLFDSGSGLGAVDLFGTGEAPYRITWWENPRDHGGNARTDNWIPHAIANGYDSVDDGTGVSYATTDVNHDGRQDVVTAEGEVEDGNPRPPGGVIWWQAPIDRKHGLWTKHTIDAGIQDVHNLRIADVNGDGESDIVFAEQDQSVQQRVGILFNVGGAGKNWELQVLATDGGHNQWVADDDGDGDQDILSSPHGFYSGVNPIELFQNGLAESGILPPQFTQQPTSTSVADGGTVTFTAAAHANAHFSYQWLKNGVIIPGKAAHQYISKVTSADNGAVYRCIISDAAGFVSSSSATLTVTNPASVQGFVASPVQSSAIQYVDSMSLKSWLLDEFDLLTIT